MNVSKARNSKVKRSSASENGRAAAGKAAVSVWKLLATILLIFVLVGCICVCVMVSYILGYADSRLEIPLDKLSLDYTTSIYAYDDEAGDYVEIEKLYSEENRVWIDYEDMSENLRNAFMAVEDQRFREHDGVDWKRTILSFVNLVVPIYDQQSGGSTITQQLIKNITGEDDVRIERKIKEIMEAINLEKEYDKDVIITAYLNTIFLGSHAYGVEAAAQTYFGKSAKDLTIAECASIAGITRNPSKYSPFANKDKNHDRQLHVLKLMHEQGLITDSEYDDALSEAEHMNFQSEAYAASLASRQTYFVDEVRRQVVRDLCDKLGWEETYAKNQLLTGGYRIYATIDPEVQACMEEVWYNEDLWADYKNANEDAQPQGAVILMESDGKVVGIIGARGEKTYDMSLNYATQTTRQPGSSIKPLSVYSAGLEHKLFTYSTMINDHDLSKDESWTMYGTWMPKNSDGKWRGYMTVCEAMARSVNTVAAQLMVNRITPEVAFTFASDKYNLTTLIKSQKVGGKIYTDCAAAPMTLGALTKGVTLEAMVAAYQAFTNGGTYQNPYYYTEVKDSTGKTILKHADESVRVISEETSYIMEKMLEYDATFSGGTIHKMLLDDMTIGGKTGTTNDKKDKWVIGFTPYYLGGVWLGIDNYGSPYTLGSKNLQLTLWHDIMTRINEVKELTDKPVQEKPSGVVERYFCPETGLLCGPDCPNAQLGYYTRDNLPDTCTHTYELYHGEEPPEEPTVEPTEEPVAEPTPEPVP